MNHVKGFSDRRADGTFLQHFIHEARMSRAFEHVSDEVITQWIYGRFEQHVFPNHFRRQKFQPKDRQCFKCKGKGWFGRGRPVCTSCDGSGRDTKPVWINDTRTTGLHRRILDVSRASLSGQTYWPEKFTRVYEQVIRGRPADGVKMGGVPEALHWTYGIDRYPCSELARDQPSIFCYAGFVNRMRPEVKECFLSSHFNLGRLAKTFGCTCPITGEFVSRAKVTHDKLSVVAFWRWEYIRLLKPLGFIVRIGFSPHDVFVAPFSSQGLKAIRRAVNRCHKVIPTGETEAKNAWVLAELMQRHIVKAAA